MATSIDFLSFSIVVPTFNRRRSLARLLDSVKGIDYPQDLYEIIVVDDGSTDDTSVVLDGLKVHGNIRVLHIPNSGPAVARNRGAAGAKGEIIAFVDDDCAVPADWLRRLNQLFHGEGVDAVGGAMRNALTGNIFAVAYDDLHMFFSNLLNNGGRAAFLATSNFACRTTVFREMGGFDERFHVGAEDREIVARLTAGGKKVVYGPSVSVDHFHAFTWKTFIRQYFRFGKGSSLLFRRVAGEKGLAPKRLPLSGYLRLFGSMGKGRPLPVRMELIFLAILAQAFALLGYLATSWEGIGDIVSERRRLESAGKMGIQGRAPELVFYLAGMLGSSALGFVSFLLMGKMLSIEQFGGFTLMFSLSTLLQTLGATGISAAVTRHAVEGTKGGDPKARADSMKSAALLFLLTSTGMLGISLLAWKWLVPSFAETGFGGQLAVELFMVGTFAAMAFDFFGSAYAITHRLLPLSLLRFCVSLIRLCAIVVVLVFHFTDPVLLYAAFFLPNWIGVALAAYAYMRSTPAGGRVRGSQIKGVAAYAGWQSFSSTTTVILQHAGSLVLAAVSGQDQVGYYGLGLTFSFMYSVVAASLASYFIPIGMRLRTNEDVLEFVRRTTRLCLPIILVCTVSLIVVAPLFSVVFGEEKTPALPVFVLLSLSSILGIGMVGIHALFHFFFRPRLVTYAQCAGLMSFLLLASAFSSEGAVGIAAAFLGARLALFAGLLVLIKAEFSTRGIVPVFRTIMR